MKDLAKSSQTWNYWNLEAGCYYFLNQPQHHRSSHEKNRKEKQDQVRFPGNCPPTPSLS